MEFSEDFELKKLSKKSKISISINTSVKLLSSNSRKSKFHSHLFSSHSEDFSHNPDPKSILLIQKDLSYLKQKFLDPRSSLT